MTYSRQLIDIELNQLVNWIWLNRKKTAFHNYGFNVIWKAVLDAMKDEVFIVAHEGFNYYGVVCGKKVQSEAAVYIYDILTVREGIIKNFMKIFLKAYPEWTIKGRHRSGRSRHFTRTTKLMERLH